jgi:hypothetical protein
VPPRNGLATPAPPAAVPPPTPAELQQEYVSGGGYAWDTRTARALPWSLDDEVSRDFGADVWDRMVVDSQVSASLSIFKAGVLEDGLHLSPALDDEEEPDYELATTINDEAVAMLDELQIALSDVLWDMGDAVGFGNRVAEQVYELRPGYVEQRELLQLKALKVKPRELTAFVVDPFLNLIGLLAAKPGAQRVVATGGVVDPKSPDLLPRDKFAILTFRPKGADPRETSLLRPAFDPWWRKRQVNVEFLKFLAQFAGPSVWGTVGEKAQTTPFCRRSTAATARSSRRS